MLPLLAHSSPSLPSEPERRPRYFSFVSGAESGLIAGCGNASPSQCSGHGICQPNDVYPDQGVCQCDAPYTGRHCDAIECPVYGELECAGYGVCEVQGEKAACVCGEGHAGTDCGIRLACDPFATGLPCRGRGKCLGNSTCVCDYGYSGSHCETDLLCPLDSMGRPCSDGGYCVAHACLCKEHRWGPACEDIDTTQRDISASPDVSANSTSRVAAARAATATSRARGRRIAQLVAEPAAEPIMLPPRRGGVRYPSNPWAAPSNSWAAALATGINEKMTAAAQRSASVRRGRARRLGQGLQLLQTPRGASATVEAGAAHSALGWPKQWQRLLSP